MGIFTKRERATQDTREARLTIAKIFQLGNEKRPYRGSPAERVNRGRRTTRGQRGWL